MIKSLDVLNSKSPAIYSSCMDPRNVALSTCFHSANKRGNTSCLLKEKKERKYYFICSLPFFLISILAKSLASLWCWRLKPGSWPWATISAFCTYLFLFWVGVSLSHWLSRLGSHLQSLPQPPTVPDAQSCATCPAPVSSLVALASSLAVIGHGWPWCLPALFHVTCWWHFTSIAPPRLSSRKFIPSERKEMPRWLPATWKGFLTLSSHSDERTFTYLGNMEWHVTTEMAVFMNSIGTFF